MAIRIRRHGGNGLDAWPGYVDALTTLLMVIIFVLLVFVLAQGFLSAALSGRSQALDTARRELAELRTALNLEQGRSGELQRSVTRLGTDLDAANTLRTSLAQQLATMRDRATTLGDERDRLKQTVADANLAVQAATVANDRLRLQLADVTQKADTATREGDEARTRLADTLQQLAAARQRLEEMQRQIATLDQTVKADKETIETKLSELARLAEESRAMVALRERLEQQLRETMARVADESSRRQSAETALATTKTDLANTETALSSTKTALAAAEKALETKDTSLTSREAALASTRTELAEQTKLGESARAELALLNQEVASLRSQLASIAQALELSSQQGRDKDARIADLGQKLNVALANKVEELQRYRSDFFGRLRTLLENRTGIQVVGDRFVFQSEVLFPVGSAELTPSGIGQMTTLAITIKQIASEIPPDVPWLLRVDGHTDSSPVRGGQFASNWELSSARAITVVKLLIAAGVPPERLAATGFGEYQPIASGDTPEAYARNRRIELRLTDR